MAKAIATITGTALRPGVSRNKRWYKPEHIAGAVTKAQERIAAGQKPMVMLTYHDAQDNSREIAAALTSMSLTEDGRARFAADFLGTEAGRDIALLADNTDGRPALRNVSIRGAWTGKVRRERGPDGQMVETADGLELDGIDFTKSPGVDGAEIETFSWAAGGQHETDERVLITESVEATVTVTEEGGTRMTGEHGPELVSFQSGEQVLASVPEGVRETLAALLPAVVEEADTPAMSGRKSGLQGSGRVWADPGYQADHRQRYDITDKPHAITAWRYINQASKAAKYSAAQLKKIKQRIRAALAKFGVKTAAEGWVIEPAFQITEAVAEFYGEPSRSGSWCISASNGPVNLSLSSYGMDPADLDVILRAAADASCKALAALDPDMDGDIDVPGANDADTDHDAGRESVPPPATTENAPSHDNGPEGGPHQEGESAVPQTESTTQTGGAADGALTLEKVQETAAAAAAAAVREALEADRAARKEAKAAKRAAAAAEAAKGGSVTETGGETQEGTVTESQEEREARLIAAALKAAGLQPAVQETEEQRIERVAGERLQQFIQEAVGSGAIIPGRTGMVVREHRTDPDAAPTAKDLSSMSDDDFQSFAGKNLDAYTGDHTRIQSLTQ